MASTRIVLNIAPAEGVERAFVFEADTECLIGRATDCDILIPTDEGHADVSRHHCVLEIHPPEVRVRDLGSLNGTYVNGRKIGQRLRQPPPGDSGWRPSKAETLHDGDELRVGHVVFQIHVNAREPSLSPFDL